MKGILATVDDIQGGAQPFAVPSTSVQDVLKAPFAKSGSSLWSDGATGPERPSVTTLFAALQIPKPATGRMLQQFSLLNVGRRSE